MKVRIGVADADRVVELEVEDGEAFETELKASFDGDQKLLWFEDTSGRRVAIPKDKLAFVEFERSHRMSVGFG